MLPSAERSRETTYGCHNECRWLGDSHHWWCGTVQVSRNSGPDSISVLGNNHIGNIHTAQLGAVDPATVDCVVITNFHNMLALPYITERCTLHTTQRVL